MRKWQSPAPCFHRVPVACGKVCADICACKDATMANDFSGYAAPVLNSARNPDPKLNQQDPGRLRPGDYAPQAEFVVRTDLAAFTRVNGGGVESRIAAIIRGGDDRCPIPLAAQTGIAYYSSDHDLDFNRANRLRRSDVRKRPFMFSSPLFGRPIANNGMLWLTPLGSKTKLRNSKPGRVCQPIPEWLTR